MKIPDEILTKIFGQAEKEYPKECCGVILGPKESPEKLSRLWPCQNVQDDYHGKDPKTFPRNARTAYFIDPKEQLMIQKELNKTGEEIRVIYHSHIDAEAYFSDEDARLAAPEGSPTYPDVGYLVVSVMQGKAQNSNLFKWNSKEGKYLL